jgi:hypothetical protein
MVRPDDYLSPLVHQASGMVSVQLECSPREAVDRMVIRSDATNLTLEDLARLVVERTIRFEP